MQATPPTVIIRHKKENLRKCSLTGLEERGDLLFLRYPGASLPDVAGYRMLSFEGPLLTQADAQHGVLLIDGTWRNAEKMCKWVEGQIVLEPRSLPAHLKTAYPRRQDDCALPERGLASVEALAAMYHIFGRDPLPILDHYYWKAQFLELNRDFFHI